MYDLNSPAVTTHLSILGEIINRLANNSNYCKSVCVAVVAAFATFKEMPDYRSLIVWCIPVVAIAFLDSLFVFLKDNLTEQQEQFVKDINKGKVVKPFVIEHNNVCAKLKGTLKCLCKVSIWLFYVAMLLAMVLHVYFR